jgi:hypothetical protein
MDDMRLDKIEKLKRAMADGTYDVRADELARKLIDHMLRRSLREPPRAHVSLGSFVANTTIQKAFGSNTATPTRESAPP